MLTVTEMSLQGTVLAQRGLAAKAPVQRRRLFGLAQQHLRRGHSRVRPGPGFKDHHVGDAIQPSHPLLPSSPPALNLSQHQVLFQ